MVTYGRSILSKILVDANIEKYREVESPAKSRLNYWSWKLYEIVIILAQIFFSDSSRNRYCWYQSSKKYLSFLSQSWHQYILSQIIRDILQRWHFVSLKECQQMWKFDQKFLALIYVSNKHQTSVFVIILAWGWC